MGSRKEVTLSSVHCSHGVVIWKGTEIECGIFLFFPRYVKFRIGDEIKEQH